MNKTFTRLSSLPLVDFPLSNEGIRDKECLCNSILNCLWGGVQMGCDFHYSIRPVAAYPRK